MARLPVVGSDDGQWGSLLNDFLQQSHTTSGALTSAAVSGAGATMASNNLNDVADKAAARTNLAVPSASGFGQITVGSNAPTSPAVGDIWIETP